MVAKSYETWEIIKQPYFKNGRQYVVVLSPKGKEKEVRYYTEKEYARMYKDAETPAMQFDAKTAFWFNNDSQSICLLKSTDPNDQYLRLLNRRTHKLRFANHLGWFTKPEYLEDLPSIKTVNFLWRDYKNQMYQRIVAKCYQLRSSISDN